VRVNHPLTWDGVSFYQSSFGSAAAMKVTDGTGKTLYGDNVPLVWGSKDGQHSVGQFPLAGKGLTVFIVEPASGKTDPTIKAGQVQLEITQDGQKEPTTQVVDQGKPTTIAGLTYTFERTRPFTGLIVARDPGAIVRLGGLDPAGGRTLPRLLLPTPSRVGAGPQDIGRQRDPLRFHHEA